MEPKDITVEILTDIRDEIRLTNRRLDGHERLLLRAADTLGTLTGQVEQTNTRLDHVVERLDDINTRLERVEVAVDVRGNPAFVDLQRRVEQLERKVG